MRKTGTLLASAATTARSGGKSRKAPLFIAGLGMILLAGVYTSKNREGGSRLLPGPNPTANLSTANVQRAVDRMLRGVRTGGAATVIGVRETGGGNAIADVQFQNFTDKIDFLGQNPFNGAGEADIVHYTDGRTVMSKVTWNFGRYVSGANPL